MKKIKILSIILATMLTFSATGCVNESGKDDESFTFPTEHYVSGTLHDINIVENENRPFILNQYTDYVILQADDAVLTTKAASLIVQNVKRATGANISTKIYTEGMENTWTENDKLIVLNAKPIFEKAGLTMPNENLGESGYYIKTKGNTVFIMNPKNYGYQMGAIKFLEATLGYDMLGEGCWYYGKEGKTIPDMDIVEKPDFDFRTPSNSFSSETAYGMGYNMYKLTSLYMTVSDDSNVLTAAGQHTSFRILPPAIYCDENKPETYHPDWYWHAGVQLEEQLCYTARGAYKTAEEDKQNGVPNEFNLMVQTAFEKCMRAIDDNPDKIMLQCGIMDNESHCGCDSCLEVEAKYGAISAANIIFLKELDILIQEELERRAEETNTEKRRVVLALNAYHETFDPPAYLDADGKYQPIDEKVAMSETMAIDISPINSYFNSSFYEDVNVNYGETKQILGWGAVAKNIYCWLYQDNFLDYFSPFNTWDSSIENYRFCYEAGGISMTNQGQVIQKEPTNFTKFKDYINAKAYVNVNVSYKELEENYFNRYFLDAAEPMYEYFKELQAHLEYIEDVDVSVTGKIYNPLTVSTQYFAEGQLRGYLKYIDKAYEKIEKYAELDTETYEMLKRHILVESLFPRYTLLELYTSTFSPEQELAEKEQFKADCAKLGNIGWGEGKNGHLTNLWDKWGL